MRCARGIAQVSPGSHGCAGRNICLAEKNRATTAVTRKSGRYGSSTVRFPIHAPLNPREIRIKGPRQQVEANTAASPPANNAVEPLAPRESLLLLEFWEVSFIETISAVGSFAPVATL